jgi:hypothetical protein
MKKIFLLAILSLSLVSCKEYLDVNFDPSFPQVAEGYALLPPMIAQMHRGEAFDARYTGSYCQYWGNATSGNVWDRYGYLAGSDQGGEMWRSHYYSIGKHVDLIIENATPKQQWDYIGVSKALRAWSWQTTTDLNGEMILKQAWEPNRYVFDFDTQDLVYEEVVRLSNEALADLAKTDGGVSVVSLRRGDLVYNGDRSKWTKFVNGILARNAHHQSNKKNYNPDAVIKFVDASFSSNADNFNVPHNGSNTGDANFWGPLRNNAGVYRQGSYLVRTMDTTVLGGRVDPRLAAMLTASTDGIFRGVGISLGDPNNVAGNVRRVPNLWGVQQPVATAPLTGKYLFQDKAVFPIMTYWELQFIKAEAALKKGDRAMAHDAYLKGINAHLDFVASLITDAIPRTQFNTERTAYMASKAVARTPADLTLSNLMIQKYISMFVHGHNESWVDLRRHRYSPDVYVGMTLPVTPLLFPDNSGKMPYRIRPRFNSEYVWNSASLNKFGALNADYHTNEMWFMQP